MVDDPIYPSSKQVFLAGLFTALALCAMGALRWFGIPAGELVDWVVGIVGFWWLLAVTVVPWNLYFGARAVQAEMAMSKKRGLLVERDDAKFVARTARRSLVVALVLHVGSAVGFAALAFSGLTAVGWFGAGAALALTLLRPAARLYHHVAQALRAVGRRVAYPRDDVRTALERLEEHEARLDALRLEDEYSWASVVDARIGELRLDLRRLTERVEAHVEANEHAHRRLARDAERVAERLGEDVTFLGNVREIIRFVKDA